MRLYLLWTGQSAGWHSHELHTKVPISYLLKALNDKTKREHTSMEASDVE